MARVKFKDIPISYRFYGKTDNVSQKNLKYMKISKTECLYISVKPSVKIKITNLEEDYDLIEIEKIDRYKYES